MFDHPLVYLPAAILLAAGIFFARRWGWRALPVIAAGLLSTGFTGTLATQGLPAPAQAVGAGLFTLCTGLLAWLLVWLQRPAK